MSHEPKDNADVGGSTLPHTDQTLLREIRGGDEAAARALFDRYSNRVGNVASRSLASEVSRRVDADDVTQSIFRTLFRRLRDGQYDLPQGETIWQLLVTMTLNKTRTLGTRHRAAKRDVRRSQPFEEDRRSSPARVNEDDLRLLKMTILELLEGMSESQQKIIELRMEGHDIAAIANATKRSKRTVERVMQGFRKKTTGYVGRIRNDGRHCPRCIHRIKN